MLFCEFYFQQDGALEYEHRIAGVYVHEDILSR